MSVCLHYELFLVCSDWPSPFIMDHSQDSNQKKIPSQEDIQAKAMSLRAIIKKEEAEDELISGAIGHTTFRAAKPKANRSSHNGAIDMTAVDYEAVDYDSPDEIMSDKHIELIVRKCRIEMYGGYLPL